MPGDVNGSVLYMTQNGLI